MLKLRKLREEKPTNEFIEVHEVKSKCYVIAVKQFCNHIENMSQNASQYG
jgi:uncharacterized protein (DUF1015 family)